MADSLEGRVERIEQKEYLTKADLTEWKYSMLKWVIGLWLTGFAIQVGIILALFTFLAD